MTSHSLPVALETLGWSARELAGRLGCSETLAKRWARGEAVPPPEIAAWLDGLARYVERHPPPGDWRRRAA